MRAIVELLRTGVCSRLDLYGFSSGGGKYFLRNKIVSKAHPISGENYIYRLWMATGVVSDYVTVIRFASLERLKALEKEASAHEESLRQ